MSSNHRSASATAAGFHRIRDHRVAERIVAATGLAPPDLVFEFGAGDGQLTAAIAPRCRRVICVEGDRAHWRALRARFAAHPNVEPVLADFMAVGLPSRSEYKLVSNVPFGLTAALLRRLAGLERPPRETFLILQVEAARKWAGLGHETQASVLMKTRFDVEPVLALHRSSFAPRPNVDCVLVRLSLRRRPLVSARDARSFESFVRRGFADPRFLVARTGSPPTAGPTALTAEDWVAGFRGPVRAKRR